MDRVKNLPVPARAALTGLRPPNRVAVTRVREATQVAFGGWSRRVTPADRGGCPTGIAVGIGAVAVVVATVLASLLPGTGPRLGAVVLAVGLFAATVGNGRAALAVAGLAWSLGNGFLVNQLGTLRWHAHTDTWFVIGLLAAVAVGMTVAQIRRELLAARRMRPFVELLRSAGGPSPRRHAVTVWRRTDRSGAAFDETPDGGTAGQGR
jgi:MFS family permease